MWPSAPPRRWPSLLSCLLRLLRANLLIKTCTANLPARRSLPTAAAKICFGTFIFFLMDKLPTLTNYAVQKYSTELISSLKKDFVVNNPETDSDQHRSSVGILLKDVFPQNVIPWIVITEPQKKVFNKKGMEGCKY